MGLLTRLLTFLISYCCQALPYPSRQPPAVTREAKHIFKFKVRSAKSWEFGLSPWTRAGLSPLTLLPALPRVFSRINQANKLCCLMEGKRHKGEYYLGDERSVSAWEMLKSREFFFYSWRWVTWKLSLTISPIGLKNVTSIGQPINCWHIWQKVVE